MPYVVSFTVILEDGMQEIRELVYFPKPDNVDITIEEANKLIEENRTDCFFDCKSITYVSHYQIPMPTAG